MRSNTINIDHLKIAFHLDNSQEKQSRLARLRKLINDTFHGEEVEELPHDSDSEEVVFKISTPVMVADYSEFFLGLNRLLNATSSYIPHFTQTTSHEAREVLKK